MTLQGELPAVVGICNHELMISIHTDGLHLGSCSLWLYVLQYRDACVHLPQKGMVMPAVLSSSALTAR